MAIDGISYRIDQVEQGPAQIVDAVRIEPNIYRPAPVKEKLRAMSLYSAPVPLTSFFMDLPLLTGDEVPHAPFVAATSTPWRGSAAIYSSTEDAGYELDRILPARAVVGQTLNDLPAARPGLLDRGAGLEVRFNGGSLQEVTRTALLNGANAAAIGDGSAGNWEVFQFEAAELIAENTYRLSRRLRGQAGSDGVQPAQWLAGSWVVLLDGSAEQLPLTIAQRGLPRYYRIGPGNLPYDDSTYETRIEQFQGVGLRPYRPAHLRMSNSNGDLNLKWIRRTRIDGDSWEGFDVPLGEEAERYLVRIL
ncbi:MAG: hypothetical protein MK098_00430 [Marinovum sp.]|nr:hypothetical protein [Marinovum sp.]